MAADDREQWGECTLDEISLEEVLFFDQKPNALPLYVSLREQVLEHFSPVNIQVKKTQISFINRHLFSAVSFLPVRKAKERPDPYITVTFGLARRVISPRIDAAVEAYPNRWTHHIMLGNVDEIDGELLSWVKEAADFSNSKR